MSAPSDAIDTLDMWGLAKGLPAQVDAAASAAQEAGPLPSADGVDAVVVFGMGGSGISGDVLASVAAPRMSVPVIVSKGYECPAFVGPNTLVFAVSFSGNTEETVSATRQAADAGARIVVVCAGGKLGDLADKIGAMRISVDDSIPMPRAAIGAVSMPALVTLGRLGLLDGIDNDIAAAVIQLHRRRDELADASSKAAKRIDRAAKTIGRTFPLVYGAGPLGGVAAYRLKGQFNENTKIPAFANTIPELCHNEACGWGQHGDVTRQVLTMVQLRHDFEHDQEAKRFELVTVLTDEVVGDVVELRAEGDGPLAQLLDLVLQGDWLSLTLAAREDVDPGPIPALEWIKENL